jgi:hypothetical protein
MEKIKLPKDLGQGTPFKPETITGLFDPAHTPDYPPIGNLFLNHFKHLPSIIRLEHTFSEDLIQFLRKNGTLISDAVSVPNNVPRSITYDFYDVNFEESGGEYRGTFIYKNSFIKFDQVRSKKVKLEKKQKKLYTISIFFVPGTTPPLEDFEKFRVDEKLSNVIHTIFRDEHGSVTFEPFETVLPKNYDIKKYYKPDFEPVHKHIVDSLKENESGLYLLHGEPGTGKTTYIKYISSLIERDMIYVPIALIETLSDPSFLPILLKKKQSVIVIEDAEKALLARDPGESSSLVSAILNLTDGIMGNVFNISIIATYNSSRQAIDKALLRKGRLKGEYEFGKLPIEQAQKIIDENKIKHKATEPMTLAEIFNAEQPEAPISAELKVEKRMGFR